MTKRISIGFAVFAVIAALVLLSINRYTQPTRLAHTVLDTIYSGSVSQMRDMCGSIGGSSSIWVPITAEYLQRNHGSVRDIKVKAYERGMWTYRVKAQHGEYDMRITELVSNGKVGYIGFCFPPSSEWIHMGKLAGLIADAGGYEH